MLDGFDLGVGILFGTTREEKHRQEMLNTIAPFWDGNQTWLVLIGASLYGAFPEVYAVFLGAFYIPVLLLLHRADFSRYRLRVSRAKQAVALAVGLGLLFRFLRDRLRAGRCGGRD